VAERTSLGERLAVPDFESNDLAQPDPSGEERKGGQDARKE
jgi:hypothetical protein